MLNKYKTTELELRKYIGRQLRYFRLNLGLSQKKLGDVIGIKYQQIQHYENGKSNIPSSVLVILASNLGVTPVDFFPEGNYEREGDIGEIIAHQKMIKMHIERSLMLMIKTSENFN